MLSKRRKTREGHYCLDCGVGITPWIQIDQTVESEECKKCRIKALRSWAKQINNLKLEVRLNLKEEQNILKFDQMNSQRQKLLVFQLMNDKVINFVIK